MSPARILASLLLLISAVATGLLVYQNFAGAAIPGCAPGGACAQAAESAWGKVPGTGIPISFVGLAYYLSMLVAYLMWRGEIGALKWVIRLGAAASVVYLGVIFSNLSEYLCAYCLVGHICHLGFWGIHEWTLRGAAVSMTRSSAAPAGVWAAGFIIVASALTTANIVQQRDAEAAAERDLSESVRDIAGATEDADQAFAGRYLRGPLRAPIRIVAFTGYQCPDCGRFEQEIERIAARRNDISVSIKHYPLNGDCNRHVRSAMHPNACRAARAAEAAGIVGGNDGFWKMHDWLFARSGAFTETDLAQAARTLGFDAKEFFDAFHGPESLNRVREDIEEAQELGIIGTPMIFINGIELRGWHLENAVERAIEAVASTNPAPATGAADRPPSAFEKYVNDWRHMTRIELDPAAESKWIGADRPRVVVDVWGDHHLDSVRAFDWAIRRVLDERDDVQYRFRMYPVDQTCNEHARLTSNACRAARAAEAAGQLFGSNGFAAIHQWLIDNTRSFTDDDLREAAAEMGLDGDLLLAEMDSEAVMAAVQRDIEQLHAMQVRTPPPVIFINDRYVRRWQLPGHDVLGAIIEQASREPRASASHE